MVKTVAWSPDSRYIASGSADHTVQVLEATTARPIVTYKGHTGAIEAVAWSPNGKYIASGSEDHTVRVWKAP
jgi:WD40 repeat protein